MTKEEQLEFVNQLIVNVHDDIDSVIREGKTPESWDDIELRQYLADKFADATMFMSRSRKREYNNYILVNNL